jgi:hypothetical protein
MLANSVIAEGDRLAKPSMLLDETPSSSGVLAYWRGEGRVGYVGRVEDQHRITFDCAWLAQQGVRVNGCIGVYDVKNGWQVPLCVDRVQASLTEIEMKGGTPLYGHEAVSFPPLEAVCLYGGKPVEEWLASEGLDRTDYDFAVNTKLGAAYQRAYQERCPLYVNGPAAVLGGWHTIWPDDDYYLPREMRLVLWTFWEAEPWIEVFERAPNLPVRIRVS